MLEEARECPDILLLPKKLEDVERLIGVEFGKKYHEWATAWYFHNYNVVVFNKLQSLPEESAINLMLHEIDHWAQTMFLELEEQVEPMNAYHLVQAFGRTPFVEWINMFRTVGGIPGAYVFDEWIEKYPRGKYHFAGQYAYI